jgi:DNA polymerase-1
MWQALTTPGKDMHDLTAITSFGLAVLDKDGRPISEEHILDLAARDPKAFEEYQKTLIYVDQRGKQMSRSEFKNGIRVSAKNLNFGIPYGRGALDIARQVKAETGSKTPIADLRDEIQQMMDVWKTVTYKQAWDFMTACAEEASDPGYLTNPWGRKRRFTKAQTKEKEAGQEREAQNFPIQSTVADTCMIAMWLMCEYRKQHGLKFRLVNQIHDAIMVEVPEDEIEQTKSMFKETMGSIDIPIPNSKPLRLSIDIDVLTRWGQKKKED